MKNNAPGTFVLLDDFTDLPVDASEPFGPPALEAAARLAATGGASSVRLRVEAEEFGQGNRWGI
jgi:hypothetical protein